MPATIQDVAERAGVSVSTVSSYINKSKYVSPPLQERIQAAIQDLNYRPSRIARALRQRTRTLAFLVPDLTNTGFTRCLRAATAVAQERGYTVAVLDTKGSPHLADSYVQQLIELRVDGVFLALTWDLARRHHLAALQEYTIDVVGIAGSRTLESIDCFISNQKGAGTTLARYLLRLGHRELLYVAPKNSSNARRRFDGVQRALTEGELPVECATWIDSQGYSPASGYRAVVNALAEGRHFTATISFNDMLTTGVLAAFFEQGVPVPQAVSVATFGNAHTEYGRPCITSMVYDEEHMGTLAATRLIDRIEGQYSESPSVTYLDAHLIAKESTKARLNHPK